RTPGSVRGASGNRRPYRDEGWEYMATKLKRDGARTQRIAEELAESLPKPEYSVLFDHGDSSRSDVCQPTSYMGRRYGADATLSGIDIAVVHRGKLIILVEIEESAARPKTILGDIFGVAVADRVRIQNRAYPIDGVTMIVSLTVEEKGKRAVKYLRLERQVSKYLAEHDGASGNPRVGKVRVITSNAEDLVRRTERLVRLEAHKAAKTSS
ncbi:hypothetical protein ACFL0Q_05080, partial [Thermodesulfobacteriota bacterium]